jgi:macrolide-specific efflux system membrane fusion protein
VLADLEQLTMRAKVTEIDASRLATDQQARVIANALPNQPIRARVTEVDLAPTTANGVAQYGVSLTLIDPPPQLKPGWSASAQVTVAEANEALAVPAAALRTVGADSTVTVLAGGQEVRRTVRTGVRGDQLVQITSGLHEGEQVVLPSAPVPGQDVGSGKRFWGGG